VTLDQYKGINEFKKGYQPRTYLVKDENGDLLADPHNILNMWKNYFSQLLTIPSVSDVGHKETQTAVLILNDPRSFEVEVAIAKF
jgi:hypothetical protein